MLLLLSLYGLFAAITRSPYEIISNIVLGLIIFGFLLLFYLKGAVGGGDVKLVPVAALFVGTHSALPFSVLLLGFTGLHLLATRTNLVPTLAIGDRRAISYAPSIAAALICVIILDCL